MKLFYFFSFILILTSCRTCYEEAWCIDKYPMEWSDTIIYPEDHWHFQNEKNEWVCVELESDTICLDVKDTLCIERLDFVYYKKERKK